MTYKTHAAFALLPAIIVNQNYLHLDYANSLIAYSVISFGALVPDIDEEESYIGKRFTIFSYALKMLGVKHRGITHIAIAPIVMFCMFYFAHSENYLTKLETILIGSFIFGYTMHLAGDMLTKGGINRFLYPLCSWKGVLLPKFLRFKTSSFTEKIILFALLIIDISLLVNGVFYEF